MPNKKRNLEEKIKTTKQRSFMKNKRFMFAVFFAALALCMIAGLLTAVLQNQMYKVEESDEDVSELLDQYFGGSTGCMDYENLLIVDGTLNASSVSDETKEAIVVSYIIRKGITDFGYNYINSLYQEFFGTSNDIAFKTMYGAVDGMIVYDEENRLYHLDTFCGAPDNYTCTVIDEAYRNSHAIKLVLKTFTVTEGGSKFFAGIDTGDSGIQLAQDFSPSEADLPKWEVWFKYNDRLKRYILDRTTKIN